MGRKPLSERYGEAVKTLKEMAIETNKLEMRAREAEATLRAIRKIAVSEQSNISKLLAIGNLADIEE